MHCIRLSLSLLFVSIFSCSFSQNASKIDSLKEALQQTKQDTNRAKILDYLTDEYFGKDWDKVRQYSQEALTLSKSLGFIPGEINASIKRGICYAVSERADSAIILQKNAIKLSRQIGDTKKEAKCINTLGIIYSQQSMMDSSLKYNLLAVEISKEIKDTAAIANALYSVATIYYSKRDFNAALKGYLEALALGRLISRDITLTVSAIGMCYQEMGQWEKAKKAFEESLELGLKNNNPGGVAWAHKNLGALSKSLNEDPEIALKHFNTSVEQYEQIGASQDLAEALLDLGRFQIGIKNYQKAETIFQRCHDIFTGIQHGMGSVQARAELARAKLLLGKKQEAATLLKKAFADQDVVSGMPETVSFLYENLMKTYSQTGDFEQAFIYSEKTRNLKDSLLQQSRDRDFAEMAEQYEADKREATISLMEENDVLKNKEIKTQKTYLGVVGIGAFLLAGLAFLLYRNSQKRKTANVLLSQQKAEIEKQNDQKAILLKEIHHRVKNNLQIISSLLKLQSKDVEDEAALEALNEGRNRVWSMALIHQRLYQRDELGNIDMQEYIEELVANISHSFAKSDTQVEIETNLQPVEADVDMAIPLGLILRNCLDLTV